MMLSSMDEEINSLIDSAIRICKDKSYIGPSILKRELRTDMTKAKIVFSELEKLGIISYFFTKEYEGVEISKVDAKRLRKYLIN